MLSIGREFRFGGRQPAAAQRRSGHGQGTAIISHVLQAQYVGTMPGLTDQCSGSRRHVATMFPVCQRGWFWTGQRACTRYDQPLPKAELVFRPHPAAVQDSVARPVAWSYVWGIARGWAMWRPIPPAGYVALGDVFHYNYPPDREETFNNYVCVREDCVTAVPVGPQLWNDHGTGARDEGSMWVIPDGTGNPWQRFRVHPSYDRPSYRVYVLNMDAVDVIGP